MHLRFNLFKICTISLDLLDDAMHFFRWFGVEVESNTLLPNIIWCMLMRMHLWKFPALVFMGLVIVLHLGQTFETTTKIKFQLSCTCLD